ncbi:MAG: hypothetical protein ABJ205_14870 [Erythrobacter sp.]|uniref:hypothetical protein n=1 Tax=Erythrobacter sp. TaxID=1042 RepID=UPI0032637AE2
MSALRISTALLFAVFASSVAVAQPGEWSTAQTTYGTVSAEVPCAKEAVQTKERDGTEAVRCDVSGITVYLFVLKNEMIPAFGFPGSTIAEIKQSITKDADTVYLTDVSVSGYPAFFSEGRASDGKVAIGVVELDDGRTVMLNVQTDGSEAADAEFSSIFVRSWESLQVTKP